jgi:hypothetical protein
MLNEIAIVLEGDTDPPRFHLSEGASPPRIASAAVVDEETEQPVWWLVPGSFTAVLPFTIEEVTPQDVEDLADAEPFDPIEDLPPSDPRHKAAITDRDESNESAFPPLASLTYGVVPPGFRQASPEDRVEALVPGRAYNLTVMGPSGSGSIGFRVKSA